MMMSFRTKEKGHPTNVVEKILALVTPNGFSPKKHSIRGGEQWKADMPIHMYTGAFSRYRQFNKGIPELEKVISVQTIEILYENVDSEFPNIYIDGRKFSIFQNADLPTLERLVSNEGGGTFSKFIDRFSWDFSGQIVHWTTERY